MNEMISVIVPIYNSEKYLPECIESILSQTHKNLELILVNDGSTDNSLNICNYYKSQDDRVVVVDKSNEGVSATRNRGIEIAVGDYIGFVDSDDYIEKNMYEVLISKLRNDKSQVCAMTSYAINSFNIDKRKGEKNLISGKDALKHLLLLNFPTSLWAFLYSRDVIKKHNLNNKIHFFEDFEFNLRILSDIDKVSICNQMLYNYRINENSTNRQSINKKRMTCLNIYNLIIMELKKNNRELVKYAIYFRAHCLISVIASISKSKDVNKIYYELSQKNSRSILWKAMFSRYLPIKYKVSILMYSICPYLFAKFLKHISAC